MADDEREALEAVVAGGAEVGAQVVEVGHHADVETDSMAVTTRRPARTTRPIHRGDRLDRRSADPARRSNCAADERVRPTRA